LEGTLLASVDFEKAYDSIPKSEVWQIVLNIGNEPELTELAKELCEENIENINIGKRFSGIIIPTKGFRHV
jgi:hypothetical protein